MSNPDRLSRAERDRLERLVHDHGRALLSLLLYRTGDRPLAEDLLADTLERAILARRRFDPRRGSERTWLSAIALNTLRDHARRRGAEARAYDTAQTSPDAAHDFTDDIVERHALTAALSQLPSEEREALALVYGADLTATQAARALEVPVTTVQGRVYRGLGRLREMLGEVRP